MSFGGILATALAGGAGVIGKQAGDDIEAGRKSALMREQADIEEQMRMRLAEFNAGVERRSNQNRMADTRDFQASDETIAASGKVARAAGATARDVERERLADTGLNEAARKKAADDADAANATTKRLTIANAGDPAYLKAKWTEAMADPRVKAAYTASMAAAGASGASNKLHNEQYAQLVEVGKRAGQVRGLQMQLTTADPAAREVIQQQIADLVGQGKDPTKYLALAEKAQDNVAAALKVLADPAAPEEIKAAARVQMQRATDLSNQAARLGGIKLKEPDWPEPPAGAIADLKRDPASAAFYDKTFGPGAAAKVLGKEAPAQKAPAAAPEKGAGMLPNTLATDPMKARVDMETREINNMKRTAYSAEVQAYLDEKRKAESQRAADEQAAYQAAEFRRAQAAR